VLADAGFLDNRGVRLRKIIKGTHCVYLLKMNKKPSFSLA
jgi:hypothetical protein